MSHLRLIAAAALRERVRWAREHLYLLAVLGPVVVGMTYFGVGRLVREGEWSVTTAWAVAAGVGAAAALVVLGMSRASAEIYHVRRPESFFESLPVETDTHFHVALVSRAARTLPTAFVAVVARTLAGVGPLLDAALVPALLVFVAVVSLAEVASALQWIHWGHARSRSPAAGALAFVVPGLFVCGLLLVVIVSPAKLPEAWRWAALAAGAAWSAAAFLLARGWHARWRRSDMEFARRLGAVAGRDLRGVGVLTRRLNASTAALVARDLRLTLRRFSSAVYVSAGLAALILVALFALLTTGVLPEGEPGAAASWLDATWLAPVAATKVACVLATVALSSLAAPLVAHELSRFWVERAAGAGAADVSRAKLWYARVVSAPAPAAAWAAGALSGEVPAFYVAPLLLENLWLWLLVSTVVGSFAFEIPEQPGLALVLMSCTGLAAGLLVAWLWPVGFFLLPAIPSLVERGAMRARYYLIEGGD
ncbi:MAG TPA: hypothetical protein VER32_09770 [Pyrinomonadaceae bacterium]|nr:hypothetical protein [Pyrinomonadaceae bacterium]